MHELYFGTENVTILFEWTQEEGLLYNITVVSIPLVPLRFTDSNTVLLTVSYNILYNVSVIASGCGQTTTNDIHLHYGKKTKLVISDRKIIIYNYYSLHY